MTNGTQLPNAALHFLPWVRQGIATAISTQDTGGADVPHQATLAAMLQFNAIPVPTQLRLYGPGDVTGIDPRQVVRIEPKHLATDVETNYFPLIEFDRPDFPWLFTPAQANAAEQLRPWLCLIVVRKQDGVTLGPNGSAPLPVLHIQPPAQPALELPDLREAWAWAHAQAAASAQEPAIAQMLRHNGVQTLSRLLCPRQLEPNTQYYACVVPTFKAGRTTGLGDSPPPNNATLLPAWDVSATDAAQLRLPVYYQWEFSTGAGGDFESLVRHLEPRRLPPVVGRQRMDISAPHSGLPNPTKRVVYLGGALRSPQLDNVDTPISSIGSGVAFQQRFKVLLNSAHERHTSAGAPIVGPPLYGSVQADRHVIPSEDQDMPWLRELNLDPRYRAAAGLGVQVVQEQQEQLMAAAWEQAGQAAYANQLIRYGQLQQEVGRAISTKHLKPLVIPQAVPGGPGLLLQLTAPLHTRVRLSPQMVHAALEQSSLPTAAVSGAFRRITRPNGPVAHRLLPEPATQALELVQRLAIDAPTDSRKLVPAPPVDAPAGTLSPQLARGLEASNQVQISLQVRKVLEARKDQQAGGIAAGVDATVQDVVKGNIPAVFLSGCIFVTSATNKGFDGSSKPVVPKEKPAVPEQLNHHITATELEAKQPATFALRRWGKADVDLNAPDSAREFLEAAKAHQQGMIDTVRVAHSENNHDGVESKAPTLIQRLDPSETVPQHVWARVQNGTTAATPATRSLDFISAEPTFSQPMYAALRDLGQDFLLPGVEHAPPNTVALLQPNARFIEAFLVGLNHEMSRELLWREYPTSGKQTYFRQFWDVRGRVSSTSLQQTPHQHDIDMIETWPAHTHLGGHMSGASAGNQVVLLIRGDVLRRYPTATIYAVEAQWSSDGTRRILSTHERYPLFSGRLDPDITFLGFALGEAQARGTTNPSGHPGWFFVLQQQPTEPRFGLDATSQEAAPNSWNDLAWTHVRTTGSGYLQLEESRANVATVRTGPSVWAANAAHMAHITLQKPVRIAIHADDMLPRQPEEG